MPRAVHVEEEHKSLSLTTKLGLGFLFAVVLQIAQMVISSYFTAQMQSASLQVAHALNANMAVQAGVDAIHHLEQRAKSDAVDPSKLDLDIYSVYVDEVCAQSSRVTDLFDPKVHGSFALACDKAVALKKNLAKLRSAAHATNPEDQIDELAFFADAVRDGEEALLQAQVHLRGVAEEGVRNEQAVHGLPLRASMAITLGGVVLMAAFVTWFSRQLVIPIEHAWAALEGRVQERTAELATSITDLRREIAERERAEAKTRELHVQLVETSRRAGMAEIANGVLHNVGNVLNNVNVSTAVLIDRLRKSKVDGLEKAVALIAAHEGDLAEFLTRSKQGMKIPSYLRQLAEHLEHERTTLLQETTDLSQQVDHMKEIVCRQQTYSRVSGTTTRGRISELVDDVVAMEEASFRRHDIRIEKRIEADPECDIDRSRVMQILMNLLTNAKHSLVERNRGGALCEIAVTHPHPDRVRLVVKDNGIGIPKANLAKIFAHGFTTKKDGHGFGLHHSANGAGEMGGRLWAESDGEGLGATFILELPLHAAAGPTS